MKTIEVICPLYNAEKYLPILNESIKKEKNINLTKVTYLLTESEDSTENILKSLHASYCVIKKDEFSHSLTRENAVMASDADYVLFLSQDVVFKDDDALSHMVSFMEENKLAGCYGRQISKTFLDKYFRMFSYSGNSHIYGKKEYETIGRKSIFFSDAFSMIDVKTFKENGGYDHKRLNTNEDMYYANKCLKMDLRMGYDSDAAVYHSHRITLKSTYKRYKEIGYFFEENKDIDSLSNEKQGYGKIIKYMLKHFAVLSLVALPFNVMARLLGMKKGRKNYKKKSR